MSSQELEAEGRAKALRHPAKEGEATEMSEARSRAGAVGRRRPRSRHLAHVPEAMRAARGHWQSVSSYDPPKRSRVS
jgi:hypothetical protein